MKSIGWKNKLLKSKLKSNSESSFFVIHGHCRMEKMIKNHCLLLVLFYVVMFSYFRSSNSICL